ETLISDLILQLLSYMAENERKRTRERQEEGIRIAKQNGVKFGRKKHEIDDTFKAVYPEWKQNKITAVEAMKREGMKSNTYDRGSKNTQSIFNMLMYPITISIHMTDTRVLIPKISLYAAVCFCLIKSMLVLNNVL